MSADPLDRARTLVRGLGAARGAEVRLVGGLAVRSTAIEGRFASGRGLLDATFEELLGRSIHAAEREAFDDLLRRLAEEGL